MTPGNDSGLRRAIGLPQATAMVVGTIIGASIFVQPSEVTGQVSTIGGILLVWLLSGVLTLFGALVCAELASIFTRSGGVYVFLKECYSPAAGFLWAWAMFWTMHSGIIAAIAVIFARHAARLVPLTDVGVKVAAIAAILALSAVNYFGVKTGSAVQTLFTAGKLIAIAGIVGAGFFLGAGLPDHFVPSAAPSPVTVNNFTLALMAGLFAFGGWHMVTYNAGETVNPRQTIPRALFFGTVIVTVCYMALNTVYLYVLPLDNVAASQWVAADAADVLLGEGGGELMSGLVIFSTFGALSGIILSGPRVYFSMARDGLVFRWLGTLHARHRTPYAAIIAQAVWSSVLVATDTFQELFTRVVFTEWIFFGLLAVGLILLRQRPDIQRGYRIWGYPFVPGVFALSSFAIVIIHLLSEPRKAAYGLLMVLAGLPVYYFWPRGKAAEETPS